MDKVRTCLLCLIALGVLTPCARPGETDQYLAWGITLEDSAEAMNRYINEETARYLEVRNREDATPCSPEDMTRDVYRNLFRGLLASKLRNWLQHSDEVDRFPENSVSFWKYQSMSIYRRRSFPYVLPMSRTIRVGDVYCGIDKFAHFFGFGRLSYGRYLESLERGATEEEAIKEVVRQSIGWENSRVGRYVDGIFSHADIEASFQGFMLARDLCSGDAPYIRLVDGKWSLVRPIDMRDYVTPNFDESYNPCHFWALRKHFVLPVLRERYRDRLTSPAVQERFARYQTHQPSDSIRLIREHFQSRGNDLQQEQYRAVFGVPPRQFASR
ncbi:MAG: hypothetical protein IT365_08070 [Candidatus Hydrogenedentes bacterium]|nr:hypothetical protein [Candidatus Hydrogenedentota bacterium]